MTTRVSEVIREWLGWCPNHPAASATSTRINLAMYVIAAICILGVLVAAPLLLTPSSQNVAVWAFQNDTGTMHFVARLPATEDASGTLTFHSVGAGMQTLPAGTYWLVIEHPRSDGSYQLMLDGDWILDQQANPPGATAGLKLFKIYGTGALQEDDAYAALVSSFDSGGIDANGTTPPHGGSVTEREYIVEK